MAILDVLKKIFGKKQALQSDVKAIESIESPIEALQIKPLDKTTSTEIQKDSFQLGLAAGYTGKSIKEIEYSLSRIEGQMVTKDWFSSTFWEYLKNHEQNEEKRFEVLQALLSDIHKTAKMAPEPLKTELVNQIKAIEGNIPLSPKMEGLLLIVKEFKEISYEELAVKLGIQVSALRGLLTNLMRRTNKIQRFTKNGKGWVRYLGD